MKKTEFIPSSRDKVSEIRDFY